MLYTILFTAFLCCLSPAQAGEARPSYELCLGNLTGSTVVAWEDRARNVSGWRRLRLRIEPGEEVRILLGFETGNPDPGVVEQVYVRDSGERLGRLTLLHMRTFSYPAFIVDELYARTRGQVALVAGEDGNIGVRLGRDGSRVLCLRTFRESELWFFF